MILPAKHLRPDRALLLVGRDLLRLLDEPISVSELWVSLQELRHAGGQSRISFDWYILALCFLFSVEAIQLCKGTLIRREAK